MWTRIKEHLKTYKDRYAAFGVGVLTLLGVALYLHYAPHSRVLQLRSPDVYPQYVECTITYKPAVSPTWAITSTMTIEIHSAKDMRDFRQEAYKTQFMFLLKQSPPSSLRGR